MRDTGEANSLIGVVNHKEARQNDAEPRKIDPHSPGRRSERRRTGYATSNTPLRGTSSPLLSKDKALIEGAPHLDGYDEKSPTDENFKPNIYRLTQFGKFKFEVLDRYVLKEVIGQGAYGVVCAAFDRQEGTEVAIKKVPVVSDHKTYLKRTLREIMFLRSFNHANIVGLRTIMRPSSRNFSDIYLLTELMETDLSCIIRSDQDLSDEHCQFFVYQILRGLKYMHSAGVIHRDLKPRNLLVNSDCDIKICDFGLARVDFPSLRKDSTCMTDYVATRWYRAPEVILGWKEYTKALDMWAVGCILAEILGRQPIFPGKDVNHQMSLIISILGSQDPSILDKIPSRESRRNLSALPYRSKIDFQELYPFASPAACDLLENLLQFDPDKRFTVEQALDHPYLERLKCDEDDEPCRSDLDLQEFEFENITVTKPEFLGLIRDEIAKFHPKDPLFQKNRVSPLRKLSKIFRAFPKWRRRSRRRSL